jgi:inhibitor of KinA
MVIHGDGGALVLNQPDDVLDSSVYALGDCALVVTFGSDIDHDTHRRVKEAAAKLEAKPPAAMVEAVPAFTTLTITYDPLQQSYAAFKADVENLLQNSVAIGDLSSRLVVIPVCYGRDLGPDLDFVASYHELTPEEVIRIHGEPEYTVYMIGFAPGFPYLGGMRERIATPRRESPRSKVPARSVAIGGRQTGIYSIDSPGGWQIIGRTPVELFLPSQDPPSLLQMGDTVRFRSISRRTYQELVGGEDD